jgi:hypothetical protein
MPTTPFYMGVEGTDLCFASDTFTTEFKLSNLGAALKPQFDITNIGLFDLPESLIPTYLVIKYQRDFINDILIH